MHDCVGVLQIRSHIDKHTITMLALLSYLLSLFTMAISQGSTAEC